MSRRDIGTYTVLRECLAASTPVATRVRSARSPVNESTVATPGVDTSSNNEQHTQAGPVANKDAELNNGFSSKAIDFVQRRQAVIRFVQDAIAASVGRQKLNADNNGRGNTNEFNIGSLARQRVHAGHTVQHAPPPNILWWAAEALRTTRVT
ncbi:unnamed protein product [Phytophthora fragariaefolia]|uniref:Unnamed protein product n=1 Tax=Phytophthora fragariaefolia TaxID=1490495 RepID=A0A9W6YGI0_9STRA|nr:unnamed protein product [Phytophthora fragariaefolia]